MGDASTISHTSADPRHPTSNPGAIASLRMVVDVGAWDERCGMLPGGQSGNPFSPHYADQFPLWQRGEGVPIAWSESAVEQAMLRLMLAGDSD